MSNASLKRGVAQITDNAASTAGANEVRTQAFNEAYAQSFKEAAAAERARIGGILTSAEAKGRDQLAEHLAFSTETTAAEAKKLLAKSPKVETHSQLATAMSRIKNPAVGADTSPYQSDDATAASLASSIVGGYRPKPQ